jgi:2-phosphosulfolactate phosphatase
MRVRVLFEPDARAVFDDCAVIIDVLRATTTLTIALANGAKSVRPVASPAEAQRHRGSGARLCGERDGRKIPGFDLGNSPEEYVAAAVSGNQLIFASTNGSRAMIAARVARRRVLGAFINARAVVETVAQARAITVICAGALGQFSLEDAGCAGLLCRRLADRGAALEGAAARLALHLAPRDQTEVHALVQGSAHGRHLRGLGDQYARDVEFCARLDCVDRAFEI